MTCGLAFAWPEINEQLELYGDSFAVEEPLRRLYGAILQIWSGSRERAVFIAPWEPEQVKELLRQGRYLLSEQPLVVDPGLFREVLAQIVAAAAEHHHPDAASLALLPRMPELQESGLADFLQGAVSFDTAQMRRCLDDKGWPETTGAGSGLLSTFIFAALKPFFLAAAEAAGALTDFSLWKEGNCPVCGRKPGMAKLREEDGARILECQLCHTQWQFARLECPFCRNKDFGGMHFFYADEFPGRRVQLCERCKNYLKTVVVKEIGRDVILELENLFTVSLDYLARREGYSAGEDLAVLI